MWSGASSHTLHPPYTRPNVPSEEYWRKTGSTTTMAMSSGPGELLLQCFEAQSVRLVGV